MADDDYNPLRITVGATPITNVPADTLEDRWNLPIQPQQDIVGTVPNVSTSIAPPDTNNFVQGFSAQTPTEIIGQPLVSYEPVTKGTRIGNYLTGQEGYDRFVTWPERMAVSGATLPGDALFGKVDYMPGLRRNTDIDPLATGPTDDSTWLGRKLGVAPVAASPNDTMIERAQDTAGLAGIGGIGASGAGAVDATLGSAPFLRPALKYEGRIYKGKVGEEHPVPDNLRADFERKAMSGEDIKDYNFGFVNHKGQFLSREKALDYAINEGLIDPSMGRFGALTSTMLEDSRAATGLGAVNQSGFYYNLERTIANSKINKATPEQWQAYLKNQPGVKPEELEWLGLNDWLKEQNGAVTRDAVAEYMRANAIDVREVTKGEAYKPNVKERAAVLAWVQEHQPREMSNARDFISDATTGDWEQVRNLEAIGVPAELLRPFQALAETKGGAKYSGYTLPGGENYRELLLTLPNKKVDPVAYAKQFYEQNNPLVPWEKLDNNSRQGWINAADDQVNKMGKGGGNYQSSHWDEPNVLAHIRMNDRNVPQPLSAENASALKVYNDAQSKIVDNRKEQHDLVTKIINTSTPRFAEYQNKIMSDVKSGKMSVGEGNRALDNYSSPKELEPLQNKLEKLRNAEDELNKVEKPKDNNLKSLHIEEIQSDWHQAGRKQGYKQSGDAEKFNELTQQYEDAKIDLSFANLRTSEETIGMSYAKFLQSKPTVLEREAVLAKLREYRNKNPQYLELEAKVDQLKQERDSYNPVMKVTNAPFKKTWNELALKRVLTEAAKNGYDAVSWTPGEAQAARYDLSKQVDSVSWDPKTNEFRAFKDDRPIINQSVPKEKLADTIGKEAAEKLLNKKPEDSGWHLLEGEELKVGGEGMKAFYDKMLVDKANALVKKMGGKVEYANLPNRTHRTLDEISNEVYGYNFNETNKEEAKHIQQVYDAQPSSQNKIPLIRITPQMREKIMKEGFPLFSSGVPVFSPVDKQPEFVGNKPKLVPIEGNPFE